MYVLAADVSKAELVFYSDQFEKHYSVPNNAEAIEEWLKAEGFKADETLVGCESTGDFHRTMCAQLMKADFTVKLLNPLLTKQFISATIRKKKTDFSDAKIIAKLLRDGAGDTLTITALNKPKRTMLRTEKKLIECASQLKRIRRSLEEKSKTMEVDVAMKAIEQSIAYLEKQAKKLFDSALKNGQSRQEEIIDSVPGCGMKLAAIISEEAGDIKRFPTARQFKAYVGIDPKVSQSGDKEYHGRISKRGNPLLRYALFLAANISRQYDPDMKEFYEKKRTEGKSYRHATCAVARKLCERIYAIVSKDELYQVKKFPLQYS